jgi:hypothetical protein
MIPIIAENKRLRWCAAKQLPVATAHFVLDAEVST